MIQKLNRYFTVFKYCFYIDFSFQNKSANHKYYNILKSDMSVKKNLNIRFKIFVTSVIFSQCTLNQIFH